MAKLVTKANMIEALNDPRQATPIYTHDQQVDEKHVFLGNTVGGEDVYFSVKFSEVIIRFGDLEPEYRAMDLHTARSLPKYQEAVNMVNRYL